MAYVDLNDPEVAAWFAHWPDAYRSQAIADAEREAAFNSAAFAWRDGDVAAPAGTASNCPIYAVPAFDSSGALVCRLRNRAAPVAAPVVTVFNDPSGKPITPPLQAPGGGAVVVTEVTPPTSSLPTADVPASAIDIPSQTMPPPPGNIPPWAWALGAAVLVLALRK